MLPIPIDITLTFFQHFFLILLAAMLVNLKIDYKKIFVIAVIAAVFNVCFFAPYVNIWLKVILTMTVTVILISIFAKLPILFSVIIVFFAYDFMILTESVYLSVYFFYLSQIPSDILGDVFMNSLAVFLQCMFCLFFILIAKLKNFRFLSFDSFAQTYLGRYKPIFLLIILIQIIPFSFYFINSGFMLYGPEILQTAHVEEILFISVTLNIFFIALSLSMLYLIKLVDKNMIKNVMSILYGEYVALREDNVQVKNFEREQFQQQILSIKKLMQQRRYNEAFFELNRIDSCFYVKELLNIQFPTLRNFLQNKIYLAQLAKIDFILEVDEDLSGLEYYVEDSLLEMLQELYNNAFEAAQEAECSEVYSKFIREENEFVILINNNGIILPSTHQEQLFAPNCTSKKALIHGQGLFKVKKLIDYYEGSIDMRGYDGYTRVTIKLPMHKNNGVLLEIMSKHKYNGLKLVK